jgi:hypothetical protein
MKQVSAKMALDSRFGSYRESSIAQTIMEIFVATTDFNNYYIERRAEESFLETAKLRSSIIQGAKQLGYVVTRPIPASTTISMTLTGGGNLATYCSEALSTSPSDQHFIQLGIFTPFTFNGNKFLLKRAYKYNFTVADLTNFQSKDYTKTIQYALLNTTELYNLYKDEDLVNISDTVQIELFQGDVIYKDILNNTNDQINKKFQVYKIDDATFSNWYGSEDQEVPLTRICINNDTVNPFENNTAITTEYEIDRRSLLKQGEALTSFGTADDTCLLRTSLDDKVEIVFGDGNYASIGAQTGSKSNIFIQYLSTKGALANQNGTVGQKITCSSSILFDNVALQDISANIQFKFTGNIIGGADIEDVDSIKILAPKIYASLDRCVTKEDYEAYLKTLTSPINVKNSRAWGEQEEIQASTNIASIEKLFNIALFTCLGELYRYDSVKKVWEVKVSDTSESGELGNAVLDDIDLYTEYSENGYFDLLVKEDSPGVSRDLQIAHIADSSSKIGQVYSKLSTKSQMTVRNVYVSPIIHDIEITGTVYVNRLSDASTIGNNIKNTLYPYLNTNADFDLPIYMSNIIQNIESVDNVLYSNLGINWDTNTNTIFGAERPASGAITLGESIQTAAINDPDIIAWCSVPSISATLLDQVSECFADIYTETIFGTSISTANSTGKYFTYYKTNDNLTTKTNMTESWFNKVFLSALYNATKSRLANYIGTDGLHFFDSEYFKNVIVKLHNTFAYIINYNLLTGENKQDIIEYTLRNEIAKIKFNATILYAS